MKIAVVYKSILGSTKKYATWLSEQLNGDLFKFNEINKEILLEYDIIVVSSGTYAGQMPLVSFLKKNWPVLSQKKVFVVAVGMAPAEDKASKSSYEMIPGYIRENIEYVKLPGKLLKTGPAGEVTEKKLEPIVDKIWSSISAQ
jgi:flavodoxin